MCEGREDDRVIFYKLKVSRHWHYFWLCSETKGRRASSKVGAKRVQTWLRGFKRQASSLSAGCNSGSRKPVLRGTHESGIRATAHCDRQIILRFPDGGQGVRSFSSSGGSGGGFTPACGLLGIESLLVLMPWAWRRRRAGLGRKVR